MALSREQRLLRSRLAINTRYRPGDPRNDELRRQLADSRREHQIRHLLTASPRLPADRLERIAAVVLAAMTTVDPA